MSLLYVVALAVFLTDAVFIGICIACWRSIWPPIIDLWRTARRRREMSLSSLELKDTRSTGEVECMLPRCEYPRL